MPLIIQSGKPWMAKILYCKDPYDPCDRDAVKGVEKDQQKNRSESIEKQLALFNNGLKIMFFIMLRKNQMLQNCGKKLQDL